MKIWEFLRELAFFYPMQTSNEKDREKIFSSYVDNLEGIAITNKCDYDWKKVLQCIQRTYTYSKFPPLADIIKFLPECRIIKPYTPCKDEGSLIVITMPNGNTYQFTVCNWGKSLSQYQEEWKLKYKPDEYAQIKIKQYPAGTVIIGDTVILPEEENS